MTSLPKERFILHRLVSHAKNAPFYATYCNFNKLLQLFIKLIAFDKLKT